MELNGQILIIGFVYDKIFSIKLKGEECLKKSKKAIAILGLSAIMLLTTKKVAYAETYQITHNVAEYNHSSLKSYESYTVLDENYDQYELQEMAVTDENGFRMINGNYLVAIGSKFGVEIGQYFDLIFLNKAL